MIKTNQFVLPKLMLRNKNLIDTFSVTTTDPGMSLLFKMVLLGNSSLCFIKNNKFPGFLSLQIQRKVHANFAVTSKKLHN